MKKFVLIVSTLIVLISLFWYFSEFEDIAEPEASGFLIQEEEWSDFQVKSNTKFKEKIIRDNGSFAFTTYDTRYIDRQPNDYSVFIYPPESSSPACGSQSLGISNPVITEGSELKTLVGKVDYWDSPISEGIDKLPSPVCRPPIPPNREKYFPCSESAGSIPCKTQMREYEVNNGMFSAYTLCAEKNSKRVLICVRQVSDNPEFAEEIFSTFRWLE